MIVYLILFTALFAAHAFTYHEPGAKNKINKTKDIVFLVSACILLSCIEGFRAYSIGTDTRGYVASFVQLDDAYETYEICSKLLVDLVHIFTSNPTVYLIVCAFLTNGLILIAIHRLSDDRRYSLFLFVSLLFYFTSFNAMRQAMAYAFVLNAFFYIREKKYIRFVLFVLIAVGFHSSALIALVYLLIPVLCFMKKKLFRKSRLAAFNYLTILIVFAITFYAYINYEMMIMASAKIFPRYEVYLDNEYRSMAGGIQQPIVYTAIFLCFVLLVPNKAKYKLYYLLPLAISVVFSFTVLRIAYLARFMYFFDITAVISIPYMFRNNILVKKDVPLFKTVISLASIAFLFYGLLNNYMRVGNYSFYW